MLVVEAAGSGLRRHAGLPCPIRGKQTSLYISPFFSLKIGDRVKFLESLVRVAGRIDKRILFYKYALGI